MNKFGNFKIDTRRHKDSFWGWIWRYCEDQKLEL